MILEPSVWDFLLILVATYVAVFSLVRMMHSYREELILHMRTIVLERRARRRAAQARRKAAMEKQQEEMAAAAKAAKSMPTPSASSLQGQD